MLERSRARRIAALLAAATLALGAAACGDDDDEDGGETPAAEVTEAATDDATEVTVTADEVSPDEFTFELSATPTAETKTIQFDNQGEQDHALVFARINEGFTVDEAFELEGEEGSADTILDTGAAPGHETTVKVKKPIEPGHYVMLCPIPGPGGEPHYKLGQLEEFDIE